MTSRPRSRPAVLLIAAAVLAAVLAACGSTAKPNTRRHATHQTLANPAGLKVTCATAKGQKMPADCGKAMQVATPAGFKSYLNGQKLDSSVTVHLPSGMMLVKNAEGCQLRIVTQMFVSDAPLVYRQSTAKQTTAKHSADQNLPVPTYGSGKSGKDFWSWEQVGAMPSPTYLYAYAQPLNAPTGKPGAGGLGEPAGNYLQTIASGQVTAPLGAATTSCTAAHARDLLRQLKSAAKQIATQSRTG